MSAESGISWTDATWNPWQGCTKVSPACRGCYMMRDKARYGQDGTIVVRSKPPTFNLPIATGKRAIPPGSLVFTCSWSDWFHEAADGWRDEAWELVKRRPDCLFLILTKRAERIADHLPADWGEGYPNVAIGVTAENQEWADKRIPYLLQVPARFRFVSIEPMVGAVDLETVRDGSWFDREGANYYNALTGSAWWSNGDHGLGGGPRLDWVIVGGESGPDARAMRESWVRELRDACARSGVAFHLKQWGEWIPETQIVEGMTTPRSPRVAVLPTGERAVRLGVDNTGALLDGVSYRARLPWGT